MFKNFTLILIFITIHAKSTYSIRSLDDTKTVLPYSHTGRSTNTETSILSTLRYDETTRRFYFPSASEGRSKKGGFFFDLFDFVRSTLYDAFYPPNDRKPPKKKTKKTKTPSKYDSDPISNFLDDLDDMFRKPFKDDSSSDEDSYTTTSSWFGWLNDDDDDDDSYEDGSASQDKIDYYDDSASESHEDDPPKPNHKVMVSEQKTTTRLPITKRPTTNRPTTEFTTTERRKITTIYTTTPKPVTIKRKRLTTPEPYQFPSTISYSQFMHNLNMKYQQTTSKPPIHLGRPSAFSKSKVTKANKDCADNKPSEWMPQIFDYSNAVETTTTSTTAAPSTAGWFNFLSGGDDENDDSDNSDTESSPGWFNGLFVGETSTKTPSVASVAQTPSSQSSWFNTFLAFEEDDASSAQNQTEKPSKKSRRKTYKGFQLLRIHLNNAWKVSNLKDLQKDTQGSGLMWWSNPALNRSADLLVPPDLLADIKDHLAGDGINYDVVIWDLQNAIAYENPKLSKMQRLELEATRGHPMTWRRYHRYADILRYMEYLSLKYPDLVELIPLGRSYEGLPIIAAKVSFPFNNTGNSKGTKKKWKLKSRMKPAIWIDGGSHAREWISPAVSTWILHTLVEGDRGNGAEMEMLKMADWYILPVVNPDGYEYTHTKDRLWRKSRSKHTKNIYFNSWFPWTWGNKECVGVDLNKNWDYHWGEKGTSNDPCSDIFAGPRPFSEPETRIIADFIMNNKEQMKVFLTLHAYAQMWILPSLYAKESYVDKDELMEMGKLALTALKDVSGTKYEIGTSSDLSHAITGTAYDWAKGRAGIKYSYGVKLRDSLGPYGYLLPGSQITPTARETWEAIKTIVDNLY